MNVTDAEIRNAVDADIPTIIELTRRAYAGWLRVLGYQPAPVTEDYGPRIERGEVWLADVGNSCAALVVVERELNHDMIFSVAVAPSFAGQGLGRRLIAFVEERTKAAGLGEIRLYTNALMKQNIGLYEHLGFQEIGRRPNPKRPGFTIVDMAKRL